MGNAEVCGTAAAGCDGLQRPLGDNGCAQVLPKACGPTDTLDAQQCANVILVQSVIRGDIADVERALAMGAEPNTCANMVPLNVCTRIETRPAHYVTALCRAAALGHSHIIQHLVEHRASLGKCDSHGWTPLCHALGAGDLETARGIAALLSESELNSHMGVVRRFRDDIFAMCEEEVSQDAADEMREQLKTDFLVAGCVSQAEPYTGNVAGDRSALNAPPPVRLGSAAIDGPPRPLARPPACCFLVDKE